MQTNRVDCGVFICQYDERLTRKAPMNFAKKDRENFRVNMTHDLFLRKILKECQGQIEKLVQVTEKEQKRKKEANIKKKKKPAKTDKDKEKTTRCMESGKDPINSHQTTSREWQRLYTDVTKLLNTLHFQANISQNLTRRSFTPCTRKFLE